MGKEDLSKIKVTVGLSGGVDSSVAAYLLKQAGFNVRGVFMKCYWAYEGCQSDLDRASAARVASQLNIPFEVWDFEKEYREKVVEYFYREYQKGLTPNPDVVCNREIKFGLFLRKALENNNILYISTGHYARIGLRTKNSELRINQEGCEFILPKFSQAENVSDGDGFRYVEIGKYLERLREFKDLKDETAGIGGKLSLFGGVDVKKDQSYFLYDIDESSYEHILFPLGNLTKTQVRKIAKETNLPTADRPDSTGICFLGDINVEKFLKERIKEHEGNVIDRSGHILGKHKGVEFYTIGQRHGFQIANKSQTLKSRSSENLPYYVTKKNVQKNELVVGMGEECKTPGFTVESGKWKVENSGNFQLFRLCRIWRRQTTFNPSTLLRASSQVYVRIRNLGEFIPCSVTFDVERSTLNVELAYPVFGVAPGQSAVFYYQLSTLIWQVAGGGIIERTK